VFDSAEAMIQPIGYFWGRLALSGDGSGLAYVGGPYAQIGTTSSLTYSDTPGADGTYEYVVQTKIAQGSGFFTSGNSATKNTKSDRTAPTMSATCNAGSCAGWFNASVTFVVSGADGAGVIEADQVVVATNAWAVAWRPVARRLLSWSSYIVLTEPVPDHLAEIGWTGGEGIADARFTLHYARTTADGRIALGGGGGRAGWGGGIGRTFTEALLKEKFKGTGFSITDASKPGTEIFGDPLIKGLDNVYDFANSIGVDPSVTAVFACDQFPTAANNFSGENDDFWCNQQADALMKQSDQELDVTKRADDIHKIGQLEAQDVPALPMYPFTTITAWRADKISGPVGAWNSGVLATKSLSQLTSTSTPSFPPAWI